MSRVWTFFCEIYFTICLKNSEMSHDSICKQRGYKLLLPFTVNRQMLKKYNGKNMMKLGLWFAICFVVLILWYFKWYPWQQTLQQSQFNDIVSRYWWDILCAGFNYRLSKLKPRDSKSRWPLTNVYNIFDTVINLSYI
jgi:hypothetical protein